MDSQLESKISAINFLPVKPKDGFVGIVSFTYDDKFYFGNMRVYTRLTHNPEAPYRVLYPEHPKHKTPYFHPLLKVVQETVDRMVSEHIQRSFADCGPVRPYPEGDAHG